MPMSLVPLIGPRKPGHIELLPIVAAQFLPGRWDRRRIGHHGVAPAVVGTKAALEHHGETSVSPTFSGKTVGKPTIFWDHCSNKPWELTIKHMESNKNGDSTNKIWETINNVGKYNQNSSL